MKHAKALLTVLLVAAGLIFSYSLIAVPGASDRTDPTEAADLAALAKVGPIDSHAHVFKDSPEFYQMLKKLNMHIVDICVVDRHGPPYMRTLPHQFQTNLTVHRHSDGRSAICTTFDPYGFSKPGFDQKTVQQLNQNFDEGAIAVKIWKNVGMELKWPSGKYVLPDDPVFEPIYKDIAAHNKTMIAHLAEPDTAWEPFSQMSPENPDYNYYKHNPFWHMAGKPNAPSKAQILAARDHLVAENPKLRVVGAHLGSMETDVNLVAQRFDRYPNLAVDTAARIRYLMAQPHDKVRAFMIKYQDRILFGTDDGISPNSNASEEIKSWEEDMAIAWKYFATDETFNYEGLKVHGLKLPPSVVKKVFHENAVKWIPGVLDGTGT